VITTKLLGSVPRTHADPLGDALDVGSADPLLAMGRMLARFGDIEVLVVRTRRGIFAVENRCPHTGRTLSDAVVSRRNVTCAGHQRRYDLETGHLAGRSTCRTPRLRTFEAAVVGGHLRLAPKRAM
jgi:nitrite reductase/ring-hydroxylating ferredoxin subunit